MYILILLCIGNDHVHVFVIELTLELRRALESAGGSQQLCVAQYWKVADLCKVGLLGSTGVNHMRGAWFTVETIPSQCELCMH